MSSTPRHGKWAPYFFIAPFILVFGTFIAYPLIQSLGLSLHQTNGPKTSVFVGLKNYHDLYMDPLFHKALWNTALFACGSIFIQLPCSLGLAMLLNRPSIKGRNLYRVIFFSPSLVGMVFVAMIFGLIFEKHTGLLNIALHDTSAYALSHWPFSFLQSWGFKPFDFDYEWLNEHAMPAMIFAALWMWVGYNMVYFLAALQNVSQDQLEAAMVDGAGPIRRFIHVVVPALRPVGSFIILLSLIGSFQLYELPYILFFPGSGTNNQGLSVVMYLYQHGFESGDQGSASAVGWVLAILLGFFALGQKLLSKAEEA